MTRIALYKLNGGKWHSQPGFGTVNMRPFQKGLHTKVLKWAWHRGTHLAYHPLLWSQQRLRSLHAPRIPDDLNRVAVSLSLQVTLGPGLLEHEFPPVSLIAWTLCKVREDMEQLVCATSLAQQELVLRTCTVGISSSLVDSPVEGPSFPGEEHNLSPAIRSR